MKHTFFRHLMLGLSAVAVMWVGLASAEDNAPETPEQIIEARLLEIAKDATLGPITPTVIEGLYRVQIIGGPEVFITGNGDHVILGDMYEVTSAGLVPLQDPYLQRARQEYVANLKLEETINFAPEGDVKAIVYVYTDVDCGYCRRLHSQVASYREMGVKKSGYNDLGIEIRYLAYPRAGIGSPSAAKLESAWCAEDRNQAMDDLKNLRNVPTATCDNPIAEQFTKGAQLGVNATPAILLPDGRLRLGYLPPEQLLQFIEEGSQ